MNKKSLIKNKQIIDIWFNNGFNGTQAYLKLNPGITESTARVNFSKMLTNTNIEDYIQKKHKEAKKLSGITHQRMLNELLNFAFSDITEVLMLSPEQVKALPIEIRRLITKFKSTTKTIGTGKNKEVISEVQVWFVSKERAFEMIAKHIGFFGEHNYQKSGILTPEERVKLIEKYKGMIENKK